MPWKAPATTTFPYQATTVTWRQHPCHGETECGDALFVETDRTDGALQVLLIDAVGHGWKAARCAGFVQYLLRKSPFENLGPAELLTRLHWHLQGAWNCLNYVEASAVHVHAANGSLRGCRAGGIFWLLGRPGGDWQTHPLQGGGCVGVPDAPRYTEDHQPLPDGAWVLVVTDGVTEAHPAGPVRMFGEAGVRAFLAGLTPSVRPDDLLQKLSQILQQHVGANWPQDDVTGVVLHRDENNGSRSHVPSASGT